MNLRRVQFAAALAVCSCLFLAACHQKEGGGRRRLEAHAIVFSVDGGNCVQKEGANAKTLVSLDSGDTATLSAQGGFHLEFSPPNGGTCNSPFRDNAGNCVWIFDNVSPANGAVGTPGKNFLYNTLTIGGVACNTGTGANALGMRMK